MEPQLELVDSSMGHHRAGSPRLVRGVPVVVLFLVLAHRHPDILDRCLSRSVEHSGPRQPVLDSNQRLREVAETRGFRVSKDNVGCGGVTACLICRFARDATVLRNQFVFSCHGCYQQLSGSDEVEVEDGCDYV